MSVVVRSVDEHCAICLRAQCCRFGFLRPLSCFHSVGYYTAVSAVVDIYDVALGTWTAGSLSVARVALASAQAGGKLIFAT